MAARKPRRPSSSPLDGLFPGDRRDRRPGTHFAAELGAPPKRSRKPSAAESDPHVDEDLGICEFGFDWPLPKA
ncbi:MAG TPA: hypothetical protein VMR29_06625 [Candidatus Binatia bacterium]|nr:hypothetical protein [Candidatus Binatia bacterium]